LKFSTAQGDTKRTFIEKCDGLELCKHVFDIADIKDEIDQI